MVASTDYFTVSCQDLVLHLMQQSIVYLYLTPIQDFYSFFNDTVKRDMDAA
jgi:hypothetical protein